MGQKFPSDISDDIRIFTIRSKKICRINMKSAYPYSLYPSCTVVELWYYEIQNFAVSRFQDVSGNYIQSSANSCPGTGLLLSRECLSHVTTYFPTFVRTFECLLCHVKVIERYRTNSLDAIFARRTRVRGVTSRGWYSLIGQFTPTRK